MRQFLDLGAGIPTSPDLHDVVQAVAHDCRIVYLDNDPIVLTHSNALLAGTPEGRTAYAEADLRDPAAALTCPAVRDTVDLSQPIAVLILGMLQYVSDDDTFALVKAVRSAVPSGSWITMSVLTGDFAPEAMAGVQQGFRASGQSGAPRRRSVGE